MSGFERMLEYYRDYLKKLGYTDDEIEHMWKLGDEVVERLDELIKLLKQVRMRTMPEEPICCRIVAITETLHHFLENVKKRADHRVIILLLEKEEVKDIYH